jgi:beta-barrel assembly-enhancing protease
MRDRMAIREMLRRRDVVNGLGLCGLSLLLEGCLTTSDVQQLVSAQNIQSFFQGTRFSEKDEIQLGSALYGPTIDQSGGPYRNSRVQKAMQDFARPLFAASSKPNLPWEVTVLDDDTVNAWALPSGKIGVNKGLLRYVASDDELAAVVGHEMGHVEHSHAIDEISTGQYGHNAANIFRDFAAGKAAQATRIGAVGDLTKEFIDQVKGPLITIATRGYSRKHEFEADQNILAVYRRTQYDPRKSYAFFETLLTLLPPGTQATTSLYSTHPDTQARIDELRGAAAKMPEPAAAAHSDAFAQLKRTFPTRQAPPSAIASA